MLDSMDETAASHPRTDREIKTVCLPALAARLNMTENNCAMISVKCLIRDVKITQTDSDNHIISDVITGTVAFPLWTITPG